MYQSVYISACDHYYLQRKLFLAVGLNLAALDRVRPCCHFLQRVYPQICGA